MHLNENQVNFHKYPLVSIIIVNYNNTLVTIDLLNSLRKITYPCVEIILVDNASTDRSVMNIPIDYPEVKLVLSKKNLGYAGGNNLGIRKSNGQLILVTNNDVEVTPGFLEPLVEVFRNYPNAGLASPKIIYHDNQKIQYVGSRGINNWTGRGKKVAHLESDNGQYDYTRETALIHGACMIFRRNLINKIGFIPEVYFVYYEEHEWATQAKRRGYELYYVGTSKIYHKAASTTIKGSPFQTYHMTRNRIMFLRRNVDHPALVGSLLFFMLFTIPKKVAQFTLSGDRDNYQAFVGGVRWHLKNRLIRPDQENRAASYRPVHLTNTS